ncbi:MAG: ABC transporter transmembrane domain-containing protein, partial [Acutalibacteraceae bacterium]
MIGQTERKVLKKRKPDPFGQVHFGEDDIIRQEQEFIDYYMTSNEKGSFTMLFKLYKSHIKEIFLSCLFYVIKQSPVWIIPIASANIINLAAQRPDGALRNIIINASVVFVMILQNLFSNYLHTKYLSLANRSVEAGLRGAIVRKLQQLSLSFHNEMQSGRIQSKIMRDVEAVEGFASQVFVTLLGIILNIAVTATVIITKSLIVFGFFAVCTAVATLTMECFRNRIANGNRSFRIENEKASA